MRQTTFAKPAEVERTWYVVDGTGKTLGRLATEVASVLRGKHKPTYTPNVDCGDFVIVTNADKIELTGNKLDTKKYYNHSGYAGGLRTRTARVMKDNYTVEWSPVLISLPPVWLLLQPCGHTWSKPCSPHCPKILFY